MFIKLISQLAVILSIFTVSSEITYKNELVDTKASVIKNEPILRPLTNKGYFDSLDLKLHSDIDSHAIAEDSRSLSECKLIISKGMQLLPSLHTLALNDLTLDMTSDGRRGLGGNGKIVIRCDADTDAELLAVFMHEMGHIVDGSVLATKGSKKTPFIDLGKYVLDKDQSLDFYNLSWVDNSTKHVGASEFDFCSTYGMTDPYEDFAECYNYYVLHGNEFRAVASQSNVLSRKYEFLKNRVFFGREYSYDEGFENTTRPVVAYDTTKLPYDITKL